MIFCKIKYRDFVCVEACRITVKTAVAVNEVL